jgi:hypothetical protein
LYRARIIVDLPSAEASGGSRFTAYMKPGRDRAERHEELTIGAWALVEGMFAAFERCGIDDAVSFTVDGVSIYRDDANAEKDLHLVWAAAEDRGVLDRTFDEMHLVLAHRLPEGRVTFDLRVTRRVVLGSAEMVIAVEGEVPEPTAANALCANVASALRTTIPGTSVEIEVSAR